jgi:hypothetical protein
MLLITAMMDGWMDRNELQLRLLDERWRLRVERPIVNQSNRGHYCLDISIETIACLNSTRMSC